MRLLSAQRLERAVGCDPHADQIIALGVARDRLREHALAELGLDRRRSLEAVERRPHEQLEADERRHRVARQPEEQRALAHPEAERLAGSQRHAPEDLLDAELRADPTHQIVRADGHSACGDHDVMLQRRLERLAVRLGGVGDGRYPRHGGARGLEQRRQHRPVRVVDLTGAEVLTDGPQLGAGAEHRDTRQLPAWQLAETERAGGADLGGADPDAGFEDLVPSPHITARVPDRLVELDRLIDRDRWPGGACQRRDDLNLRDGIGAVGKHGTGRDGDRLAGAERAGERGPGGGFTDRSEPAGRVGRPDRVAVHGRVGEGRQVEWRAHRFRQEPAECLCKLHGHSGQRHHALSYLRQRVIDQQERHQAEPSVPSTVMRTSSVTLSVPNSAEYGFMPKSVCLISASPLTVPSFSTASVNATGAVLPSSVRSPWTCRSSAPSTPCTLVDVNEISPPLRTSVSIVWSTFALLSSSSACMPPVPASTRSERELAVSETVVSSGEEPRPSVADQSVTSISRLCPARAAFPSLPVQTLSSAEAGPSVYSPAGADMSAA